MELTHLRYWMPLVIEGNKRGLQSTFYIGSSGKYNCPLRASDLLRRLEEQYNINIQPIVDISAATGLMFSSEKTGVYLLESIPGCKKIVCTYQTDFIESYKTYQDKVDHILMPSEFCADFYDRKTDKNLYLGIPKYDVELDSDTIISKYNLPDNKRALVILPKFRDVANVSLSKIFILLHDLGYTLLCKTRGKDPFRSLSSKGVNVRETLESAGHICLEDDSWFPHTTQELLQVSDIAINFGSTTIEECVMQNVPLINFDIKPAVRNGAKRPYRVTHEYLYKYDYCIEQDPNPEQKSFNNSVKYLTSTNLTKEFKKARQNHLFDHKDSCKRILDMLL